MLSFPGPPSVRLGYDQALLGRVCQRFAARVMQTLRRLTKRTHGLASGAALVFDKTEGEREFDFENDGFVGTPATDYALNLYVR